MIEVTRLNGNTMLLNSDLIKVAEASPDTMLTLVNGEKLIVRETCSEIMERVMRYRAAMLLAVLAHGELGGMEQELVRLVGTTSVSGDLIPNGSRAGLRAVPLDCKRK